MFSLYSHNPWTLQGKDNNMLKDLYSASHRDALISDWALLTVTQY